MKIVLRRELESNLSLEDKIVLPIYNQHVSVFLTDDFEVQIKLVSDRVRQPGFEIVQVRVR